MRAVIRSMATFAALALSGCGLEALVSNAGHAEDPRPASVIRGHAMWPGAKLTVVDADGKAVTPFASSQSADGAYEFRLPSSKYSMVEVQAVLGNMLVRAIVPFVGEESSVDNVDVDAKSSVEAIIDEAHLSAKGSSLKQVTPAVFVATRALIYAAYDKAGPAKTLLDMASRALAKGGDPHDSGDPVFFLTPVLDAKFAVTASPLSADWLQRSRFDYVGDGPHVNSNAFDAALSAAAQSYKPEGCPDPSSLRVVYTVDFNDGRKNGNCGTIDRFKWANDKPGKSMFFVGWIHKDSTNQDALVNARLGAGVPNTLKMYDDGTNGDEVAGDNIWTITFDLPRGLRMGYKYTWGTQGAVWTGSEEWPGNSRILQIEDINGDDLVYRRDVFGDEATNKDRTNGNFNAPNGSLEWDTVLRNDFAFFAPGSAAHPTPEARELPVDETNSCKPTKWHTPTSVGPLTIACPRTD